MLEFLGFFIQITEILAHGLSTIVGGIVAYGLATAFVTLGVTYVLAVLFGGLTILVRIWAHELGLLRPSTESY